MKKRKICVVITARPSYSRIKTVLSAIQQSELLELQIVLAGAALLERYGNIENIIERDGFTVSKKIFMVLEGENRTSMAKTTGLGILELSDAFYNLSPDVVVVIADRYETISVSIAAAYQNIPLAHIQGGEITGNIDEKVRHANTKLADIHFVSNEAAYNRVIKLGEDPAYVFNTGCPSIDLIAEAIKEPVIDFDIYEKYSGVGHQPDISQGYVVVMQHPVTNEVENARKQITETLYAVKELGRPVLWFWPNIDAGADGISKGIRFFREHYELPHMHFFKNMEPQDFLKLLYNADCLVGNSSVGIRECAYMGVPVVNIGSRQEGRDRGNNVIDVNYCRDEISSAIQKCLAAPSPAPSHIYGSGNAGNAVAGILESIKLRYHKKNSF